MMKIIITTTHLNNKYVAEAAGLAGCLVGAATRSDSVRLCKIAALESLANLYRVTGGDVSGVEWEEREEKAS